MKKFQYIFRCFGIMFFVLQYVGVFSLFVFFVSPSKVQAAAVTVDSGPQGTVTYHAGVVPTSVFISDTVGYVFHLDASRRVVYVKTTDGGATWGSRVIVDSQTDGNSVAVWYDRWTPGDTTGNYIHILSNDSGNDDLWYTRLDTTDDSQSSTISISINSGQGGNFAAGSTGLSITKSTTGSLYAGATSSVDNFVVRCDSSCTTTGGWTEAGTNPYTGGTNSDWIILLPLTDGDILTIFWDASLNDILSKEYEDTANSWDGSFQTINANADENATYDGSMAATVNPSTGDIYLAYLFGASTINSNDSIETAVYNGTSWSITTDVIPVSGASGISNVTISFDTNTETVYVGYVLWESFNLSESANFYYKMSTDAMTTWTAQIGPLNDVSFLMWAARFSFNSNERIFATWFNDVDNNVLGASVADLVSGSSEILVVSHSGSQTTAFTEGSSNQYIGSAFTFTKTTGGGDITSITLTETSGISAQDEISNIDIYYEQTGSCSYDGGETLFGTTSNFSGSETVTVTGTMPVSTSQTCAYVVFDIDSSATGILDIEIANPINDVSLSSGFIVQNARVRLSDSSNIRSSSAPSPVNIDSTVNTDYRRHTGAAPTVVFLDDDTGYTFFVDSDGRCKYAKTTDGGGSWGGAVIVDNQTDCIGIGVWYDRWTPGDTTGNYVHIVTFDSGNDDLWYTRLDTTNDSQTTTVSMNVGSGQGGSYVLGSNAPSITKATNGILYGGIVDNTDSFVARCSASCTTTGGWTEAGTNPFTSSDNDWVLLMPLSDGDILSIWWDSSANSIFSREYEDGANSWVGSWITVDSDADENSVYDATFSTTIDPDTGTIYLVYIANESTLGGGDGDIRTASYDGSSWTSGSDVLTNSSLPIAQIAVSYDAVNDDVYIVYSIINDTVNYTSQSAYYAVGSTALSGWSISTDTLNNSVNRELSAIRNNMVNSDRLYATWYGAIEDTIFGVTFFDITTASGTLSVDIVDAGGSSVASPVLAFSPVTFSFNAQNASGSLGADDELVRVQNTTATPNWTLSIAADDPTSLFLGGVTLETYDFNDTTGVGDGPDPDSLDGNMRFNPSVATIEPEAGCSSTGISLGSTAGFLEGTTDSITLVSAGGTADTDCYWDFKGFSIISAIPPNQPADVYSLDFVLSVISS